MMMNKTVLSKNVMSVKTFKSCMLKSMKALYVTWNFHT